MNYVCWAIEIGWSVELYADWRNPYRVPSTFNTAVLSPKGSWCVLSDDWERLE